MNLIGKTTINPVIFYTGKFSGYFTWIILGLAFLNVQLLKAAECCHNRLISIVLVAIGLLFTIISLLNLGKSTRLGLPSEETVLKSNGLYKLSRNPMYVGFNLITLSSIFYTLNIWVALLGVYSIIVYHLIILGEEKFLGNRFGNEFTRYKIKVRRYF